jgi:hypothetical protein
MADDKIDDRHASVRREPADERNLALANWVREAMRFIDLCDADAAGYDELHQDAERLTIAGYALFGADVMSDGNWCLADLEGRHLVGLSAINSEESQ